MIITCPSCLSRFAVKAEAIGLSGRKVRCAKCTHSWFQDPVTEPLATPQKINEEPKAPLPIMQGSNLPAEFNDEEVRPSSLYVKIAFAASLVFFLFAVSIVGSNKILPHMAWYYSLFGIKDDSGIALANISAEEIGEGDAKELLVKGRIVNQSKTDKAIPNVRIILLGSDRKELRKLMLDSHEAALAPGEGIDFENHIAKTTEPVETVIMDIGNSVSLASR